jgi:APA family basic amino acid/polyamine antiporter
MLREQLVSLAAKKLFPRSTSGLVREIGPITALFVTIAFTVGYGWQFRLFQFAGASPLPENLWFAGIPPYVMAVFITGIIVLITTLGYSILISAVPRSGGGYVMISRIVSPFAAFIGSWFEFFAVTIDLGILSVVVFEMSFYCCGPALGITSVPVGYNDVGFLSAGVFLIVLFVAIVALGVRITSYVLQLVVWIPTALSLYVLYLLGLAIVNPAILQNGITVWAQGHGIAGVSADTYVKAALAQGLDSASVGDYWTAVSVSLLGAYFAYIGYAANTFVAGEIRNPSRNLPKVLLLAPLIVLIMYVTMAAFGTYAAAAVGRTTLANGHIWSFYEAYSYLHFGQGSLQQAGVPPTPPFIATVAAMVASGAGLSSLNFLLFAFAIMWVVNDAPAMVLVESRLLFAMSFDRVLPSSLSKVNGRLNSPIYATILVGIFAMLGSLSETCVVCNGGSWYIGGTLGNLLNNTFLDGVYNVDIMDAIFFSLFSLAVVMFPFRLKRIFEKASFKPGGKLGIVTIGLAGLIANLTIAWVILISPREYNILSPSSDNWFTLGFTALLGVIGTLIYAYYRFGPSSKQVDHSAIFSEIPPD